MNALHAVIADIARIDAAIPVHGEAEDKSIRDLSNQFHGSARQSDAVDLTVLATGVKCLRSGAPADAFRMIEPIADSAQSRWQPYTTLDHPPPHRRSA
jgi:hypothetical protein